MNEQIFDENVNEDYKSGQTNMYQDEQLQATLGKTDPNLISVSDDSMESTEGLQPTYSINGYETETIDVDELDMNFTPSKENSEPNEEDLNRAHKLMTDAQDIKHRIQEYIIGQRISSGAEKTEKNYEAFTQFANSKCKYAFCFGRGIIGWQLISPPDFRGNLIHRDNVTDDELEVPIPCKCTVPGIIKMIREQKEADDKIVSEKGEIVNE